MISKDELEKVITNIKDSLEETQRALISEDLLAIISNYSNALDEIDKLNSEMKKLTDDNEELLKVNGRLFQQIGFDKKEDKVKEVKEEIEDKIDIDDLIDEKGDIK